jgi:splicing factor 3A subunit 3
MYAKQTVFDAHLTSKKHLRAAERLKTTPNGRASPHANGAEATATPVRQTKERQMALLEYQIRRIATHPSSHLVSIRADTKANVERKQALTDRERQLEVEEMEERERREAEEAAHAAANAEAGRNKTEGDDDGSDEDERIYNPLKLPLGWDGKPIPYWLYKLHGLGVEYRCEICNHTYMGRYVGTCILLHLEKLTTGPGKILTGISKSHGMPLVCGH